MLGSPSKAKSHTCSRIVALDTTSPGRRIRNSSSENCRGVSAHRRVAAPHPVGGRVEARGRRPSSTVGRSPPAAAHAAPAAGRAAPTKENGLARKSSAPGVQGPGLLLGPARAVSIRIGVQSPASRRRAHRSSPARPGQHHVEHHRVVGVLARPATRPRAVERDVDGVPLRLQAAPQAARELLVVLDHQDPHAVTVARPA